MFKLYTKDPKTKEDSVSLTLLWIAVILYVTFGILDRMGKVQGVGAFAEFLWTTMGLYFGRRIDFNKLLEKKNGSKPNEKK